ncbi:MAG TPA: PAS domain-containing protein [Thermodesulfovibrionales bacterium]|nr:PAS domain-containing protein [Thermodesulfovibrionales bacterium]
MNILSLFASFAFIVYSYLGIYTLRLDQKSPLSRTFSYLCLCFAVWAFAYTFLYSAPDKETAWFWYKISAPGWCLFPGVALHFFLFLTEHQEILRKWWSYVMLYLPGFVFTYQALTGVFLVEDFIYRGLGWCEVAPANQASLLLYALYYTVFILTGLVLTLQWGKRSKTAGKKKQARVIFVTAFPVLITTAITDSLLPALKIHLLPSIASILILTWVFGIWYSMVNYRLMILTPSIAADEIISKMIDVLVLVNPEGNIIKVNRQAMDLLGYNEDELIGKPLDAILSEGSSIREEFRQIREDANRTCSGELRYKTKGSDEIPVMISCSAVKDKGGDLIGVVIVGQDMRQMKQLQREISERMVAEEALQKAHRELDNRVRERTAELTEVNKALRVEILERKHIEETFRKLYQEFNTLLDAISDPFLMLLSPDLKIMWANRGAVSVMGREMSELIGQYCYQLWHNRTTSCDNCHVLKSFRTGESESSQHQTSDGRIWDYKSFPIKDEDGRIISVIDVVSDITEKLALQAEAIRAAHLASIGELAAGVAHEINNPVNGIINYAQILMNSADGEDKGYDIATRIKREGNRIAAIVRNLLVFARDRKEEMVPCHIEGILADSLSLIETQMRKEGIIPALRIPEALPEIHASPQQLQQVFLNIINNARYALNEKYPDAGGMKVIEISCEKITVKDSPFLQVIILDHGTGIPASLLDKVKNPFFSTKPTGKGTGLGLSISHSIVNKHNGKLIINSVEGEFTEVAIVLPASLDIHEKSCHALKQGVI